MKEVQLFINGEFLDNGDREMRENINPATEEVISLFPMATEEDVAAAVDAAYEAQKSWEKIPAIERANYLMELVDLLKENQDTLKFKSIDVNKDVAKVSIVGAGMMSNPGVAAKMFEALFNAGININMISTSEIRVTVLIDEREAKRAANAIHDAFELSD